MTEETQTTEREQKPGRLEGLKNDIFLGGFLLGAGGVATHIIPLAYGEFNSPEVGFVDYFSFITTCTGAALACGLGIYYLRRAHKEIGQQ